VDAYLTIVSKREVRAYADRPLPDDAIRRLLEAGRLAGSSRNRQARRFVVLRDQALIERAARAVYEQDNLLGAQLAVAILVRGKGPTGFDAGRAAQNMMLAAANDGIGSCPNGIADADALAAVLGQADDEQVATVLSFGYPARPVDPASRTPQEWIARADRLPFDEVVRYPEELGGDDGAP
jgi:nitroreductase